MRAAVAEAVERIEATAAVEELDQRQRTLTLPPPRLYAGRGWFSFARLREFVAALQRAVLEIGSLGRRPEVWKVALLFLIAADPGIPVPAIHVTDPVKLFAFWG